MPRTYFKLVFSTLLMFAVGLGYSATAIAQNYRFRVEKMELQVFVQPDASARLEYTIVFQNMGRSIDVVDVGLPHSDYSISNMTAAIDGQQLGSIATSEYIDVGVEVHLGSRAIRSGQTGTFTFAATMPDMVYKDTTDAARASLQIKPTWFDPQLQQGTSQLFILVHLPPGVEAGEVTWHDDSLAYDELAIVGEGDAQHVVAYWRFPAHFLSQANPKVGISFPRRVMDRVVAMSAVQLLVKWFAERQNVQVISAVLLVGLTGFWFLRFSGGTGFVVLLFFVGGLVFVMIASPGWHLILWPITIGLIALVEWGRTRRVSKYLPAMATVEGGGIRRGLTAPQAAVLLERPIGHVLTLVIFALLKKGILKQVSADPLVVEVDPAFTDTRKKRRKAAAERGIVLHDYEQPFLDRLVDWEKPVADRDFSTAMRQLINGTAGRMKGFDLSDSREYYRRIVLRAWNEAEAIGEIERRDEAVDRNFEWMILDPKYDDRFDRWWGRGYRYHPRWTRTTGMPGGGGSAPTPSAPGQPQTSFGEVASSFAGWTENLSGKFASAIEPVKLAGGETTGGFLDLSGFDRVTADVLEALAESRGGGGGGGGGCACACAGCACACACAGGGR